MRRPRPKVYELTSSAIRRVEYYGEQFGGDLTVYFTDGDVRTYGYVREKDVKALVESSSAGRFFNEHIRDLHPVK